MTAHDIRMVEERRLERPIHVLFVGGSGHTLAKGSFKRQFETVRFDHAPTPQAGIDMLTAQQEVRPFDCVIVDMRGDDQPNPLNVVAIAALKAARRCVVLCALEQVDTYQSLTGVHDVLADPVQRVDFIEAVLASRPEPEEAVQSIEDLELAPVPDAEDGDGAKLRGDIPVAPQNPIEKPVEEIAEPAERKVTKGFESTLSKVADADQAFWQRFVPVANFAYKKLAVVVLTALFLTFVVYGAMIVFFMGSSSWSLPFELSRGHALVEKAERDLSSLTLRANQVRQDLKVATTESESARRELRDGQLQLDLHRRTIDEEIIIQNRIELETKANIARLKQVINDFNKLNGKGGFATNLESAFAKRLITRKSLNSGTLAVLETLHRMATVENEIAQEQLKLDRVQRRLEFLRILRAEIDKPELTVITSAGADLATLASDVIATKSLIFNAEKQKASADVKIEALENSLAVVTANIASLKKTPAARALEKPVMVLFVPYTNTENVTEGERLVGCRFTLVFCSTVGRIGKPVAGETTAVHPLFGKPLRGRFVEAEFYDPLSVTQEIVHAKRAPMFF